MSHEHEKYLKKIKIFNIKIKITQFFIFIGFFILWELLAKFNVIDPFIFSTPSQICITFFTMLKDGSLFLHIGVTLYEVIFAFIISSFFGILISIFLWWNSFWQKVLNPYLIIFNSLPKTALAPIIIVWFGNNTKSVIFTAVFTGIIVTIIYILTAFLGLDDNKLKLIESLGGSKKQALFKVVLPASVPTIMSTLKVNIGLCFVGAIVGEFLVAKNGLGYLIVYGSQIFRMDWVMLSILILCFLSALFYKIIIIFEQKLKKLYF